MPTIEPEELSNVERYRLMIDSIVPRPIAWVTTVNRDGVVNLAPFSYFMGVASSPPALAISIGAREPIKDTLRNLRTSRQAVVHLVPPSIWRPSTSRRASTLTTSAKPRSSS